MNKRNGKGRDLRCFELPLRLLKAKRFQRSKFHPNFFITNLSFETALSFFSGVKPKNVFLRSFNLKSTIDDKRLILKLLLFPQDKVGWRFSSCGRAAPFIIKLFL